MTDTEIKNYELAVERMEKLYEEIKDKLSVYNPVKEYTQSYASYFKFSNLNEPQIKLTIPNCKNASIQIMSMVYETDKPFKLSLWKYNGTHEFTDFEINLEEDLIPYIYEWLAKPLPKPTKIENDEEEETDDREEKEVRYEQLKLF